MPQNWDATLSRKASGRQAMRFQWRLSIPASEVCLFSTRVDSLPDGTPVAWDLLHIAPPFYKGLKHEHLIADRFYSDLGAGLPL